MLELRNISAFYGTVQALRDVSIDVKKGEVVTIIGANGAGKTTLLKTIAGLVPSKEGRVRFEGKDITNSTPNKVVSMGVSLVPEGRQIFPSLTVFENLQLGAYVRFRRGEKKEIQKDLGFIFDLFAVLEERKDQHAGTLSGGEQQMLAIGRALMSKPRLLLLDEPSMGLAPRIIQDIFRVLQDLNRDGLTVLLVEQDAKVALSIADRGYVLQTGRIVLEDRAKSLIGNEEVQAIYFGKRTHRKVAEE
jgi:branched-chain amino acid transport system ATP-binding protein